MLLLGNTFKLLNGVWSFAYKISSSIWEVYKVRVLYWTAKERQLSSHSSPMFRLGISPGSPMISVFAVLGLCWSLIGLCQVSSLSHLSLRLWSLGLVSCLLFCSFGFLHPLATCCFSTVYPGFAIHPHRGTALSSTCLLDLLPLMLYHLECSAPILIPSSFTEKCHDRPR